MTLAWYVSRTEGGGGIRLDWEERQGWYYALTDLHPYDVPLYTAITVLRKDRLCLTRPSVGRLHLKAAPTPWPPPSRRAGDLATSMHCGAVAQVPVGGAFAMDAFQWVALAVVWAVTVLPGMAAIFCGWLLPWMRSRIASPRLYGGGQVTVGLGITIGMPTSHWHSPASLAGPIVGFLLIFCGVGLGMSSTRRPDQGHEDENRRGWGRSAPRL
jgi:hypothetical protein